MEEETWATRHRSTSAVGGGVGAGARPGAVMHVRRRHATPPPARPGAVKHVRRRHDTPSAGGGRLSPTMVLVMTLCFIGFATALYVFGFGKLYGSHTAAASA